MPVNKYYYLHGKVKWFRPEKSDEWGKYSHILYPDEESIALLRSLQEDKDNVKGVKNVLKKDDDGYFIRIARKAQIEVKGKIVGMGPPMVLDKDGTTPIRNILVANGSDVTTKIEVYTYKIPGGDKTARGTAIRWESSRIDELIPYQVNRDFTEGERDQIAGLPEAPKQMTPAF